MTLGERLWSVRGRWWLIILCVLIGGGTGYAVARPKARSYSATATMYATGLGGTEITDEQVASFATIATSTPVMSDVVTSLRLSESPQDLRNEVSASVTSGTTLITIAATDRSAQRAASIANATAVALKGAVADLQSDTRIVTIETATTPTAPQSRRIPLYVGVGALIGLLLGGLLAVLVPQRKRPATESAAELEGQTTTHSDASSHADTGEPDGDAVSRPSASSDAPAADRTPSA